MRIFAALMICCLCLPVYADIYKHVLPDGTVEYSNVPPSEDAEPIKLPGLTTFPATQKLKTGPGTTPAPSAQAAYTSLQITSPENDATIQDNAGNIQINVAFTPGLAAEHKLLLYLDGNQTGAGGKSGNITLSNVSRGSHTLRVAVVDAQGSQLISSPPVTFHLLRRSLLTQPGASPSGSTIPIAPLAPKAPSAQ